MSIKVIIFDVGFVLVQFDLQIERQWEARHGIELGTTFQLFLNTGLEPAALIGEVPEEELFRHVALALGYRPEQIDLLTDVWNAEMLNTELIEFIQQKLRPHYKTVVLSNAWSGARARLSQKFKLNEVVDSMFFSAEEGIAKPDLRLYQRVLQHLDVQPQEAIFVDDAILNIEAAQQLGIHSILFENNTQFMDAIQSILF